MIFEHFALNVNKPVEMADWYVNNCEMKIVKSLTESPFTHFLADKSGRVVLEIYQNNSAEIPDYSKRHPLIFHFALAVDDVNKVKDKLLQAGASFFEEVNLNDGSHLIMLRDPFGIPLQLCKRANPF